ncbi:dephospho-CoA kinase [Paracholeplasma manati]|uniref:Dephospho-CoA kinase n=1 Tax=Paracholeplasma manati TaxID=591373 RepID=A0ABT2Y6U1_9MOLU|nr:dephospho-CoA kinase [Paracholeplasma manati]MCV2232452.1 dephospho-CoA kinase [Paracholeplasma manati]MDG0887963.1 dephospho-CoA kinase [Paracholeplasma manati]
MKVLGITGGIASGKSLVSQQFKQRGFTVIDADAIVHELFKKDTVLEEIKNRFPSVFDGGILQRKPLADLIFTDPIAKHDLEHILHPKVYASIQERLQSHLNEPWVVVDIPLLYETGGQSICDWVLVVYVNEETQKARLMARNQLSLDEANQRISAQLPLKDKVNQADIVIDNSGTIQKTIDRVNELIDKVFI